MEEPGSASPSSTSPSSITEHTSSQLVGSSALALDWLSSGSNNVKGGRRNGSDALAGGGNHTACWGRDSGLTVTVTIHKWYS